MSEHQPPEHHIHHTLENIKKLSDISPNAGVTNQMLCSFAFLMSKLAEQGAKSSQRMVNLTRAIIMLTVFLSAVAVLQLVLMYYER